MNWKNKTCEECFYRVETQCRRFPPNYFIGCGQDPYPIIETKTKSGSTFNASCAEYEIGIEKREYKWKNYPEIS